MSERHHVLTLRLDGVTWAALERVSHRHGFSRAEAARIALMQGMRFAEAGHTFNVTRAVLLLEYIQAAIDVIIISDHNEVVTELLEAAKQRLLAYHA